MGRLKAAEEKQRKAADRVAAREARLAAKEAEKQAKKCEREASLRLKGGHSVTYRVLLCSGTPFVGVFLGIYKSAVGPLL